MKLHPILTIIFEKSIKTGVVPDDWKTAHVSPVYKKGKKYNPEKLPSYITHMYLLQTFRTHRS